jgi:hypothetical protein
MSGPVHTCVVSIVLFAWSIVFSRNLPLVYKYTQDSQRPKMPERTKKISLRVRKQLDLPPGGSWYYTRDPMLQEMGDSTTALPVGWRKSNNKFVFGVYETRKQAYESIFSMESGRRQAYEVIDNRPCHPYWDLEWEGERDEAHEKVKAFLQRLSATCLEVRFIMLSIELLCHIASYVSPCWMLHSVTGLTYRQ